MKPLYKVQPACKRKNTINENFAVIVSNNEDLEFPILYRIEVNLNQIPDSNIIDLYEYDFIKCGFNQLNKRERFIVSSHLIKELKFYKIGKILHCGKETVRQHYITAIAKLRYCCRN